MRRRHSPSPPIISLPVLIILLPILALILLFFSIRPFLSLTSHFFKPNSVKKSWDSFNVFLVLFAIICGIFVRRNDDTPTTAEVEDSHVENVRTVDDVGVKGVRERESSEFSQQWFGFTEKKFSDPMRRTPATGTGAGMTRMRRNSSYPDLRQESLWENSNEKPQFRFFDDFDINKYRSQSFSYRTSGSKVKESPEIKVIPVDSFAKKSPTPPSSPPPPVRQSRRTYETIERKEEIRDGSKNTPPPPPPLPPRQLIPPSPVRIRLEEKFGKNERKKMNVKKEIKMALASLYKQRKRMKKQKTTVTESRPPPSPPPPPPPPSVFRGLFKKTSKNKRVHSESPPPPPPPPPPFSLSSRSSKMKSQTQIPSPPPPPPKPSRQRNPTTNSSRPPLPTRSHNSYVENENINSGGQIPLLTIPPAPPPPPPPPPFKMSELKFGSQSTESSRCGSPEPENVDPQSSKETSETKGVVNGGGGVGPVFCPSPDVNIKAANFIARLRDGWRLEKMNSVREKERLGQGPSYQTVMGQDPSYQTVMGQGPNVQS